MRKKLLRVLVGTGALALALAAVAQAVRFEAGNIVVIADGGFSPTTLPRHSYAPIKLHGYGKIRTKDGTLPSPLTEITIWFDKHGEVETRGLPVCTRRRLEATTTKQARKLCPGAIVGKGFGKAVVKFPEQSPIPASSPITIFNGPRRHGNPTVIAHAHLDVPAPTTYLVPVEIQKVHAGRYGFKTVAEIPKIANGFGHPVYGRLAIGRTWRYKGRKLSYANASCPGGNRLQAKGLFAFADGTEARGTLFRTCKVAK